MAEALSLGLVFESTGFRSQLREASMSSQTGEFWLNETDLSVDDYIYIYIYICVPVMVLI